LEKRLTIIVLEELDFNYLNKIIELSDLSSNLDIDVVAYRESNNILVSDKDVLLASSMDTLILIANNNYFAHNIYAIMTDNNLDVIGYDKIHYFKKVCRSTPMTMVYFSEMIGESYHQLAMSCECKELFVESEITIDTHKIGLSDHEDRTISVYINASQSDEQSYFYSILDAINDLIIEESLDNKQIRFVCADYVSSEMVKLNNGFQLHKPADFNKESIFEITDFIDILIDYRVLKYENSNPEILNSFSKYSTLSLKNNQNDVSGCFRPIKEEIRELIVKAKDDMRERQIMKNSIKIQFNPKSIENIEWK
jgi:hypothetical protein